MSRQLVLRSTQPAIYLGAVRRSPAGIAIRSESTASSPQGKPGADHKPPHAHHEGGNTLIILSALGALGGLYYYYTRGQPAIDREAARRKEEEMERKVRELGDVGRSRVEDIARQGQRDYEQAKGAVQDTASAARGRATEASTEWADRARQGARDAQIKYDELKSTTEQRIGDVRDRTEKRIEADAREAENKARGWFGRGSSK